MDTVLVLIGIVLFTANGLVTPSLMVRLDKRAEHSAWLSMGQGLLYTVPIAILSAVVAVLAVKLNRIPVGWGFGFLIGFIWFIVMMVVYIRRKNR